MVPSSAQAQRQGELHLSVLIENMRREGYEFAVSKAEVIYHEDERGKKLEPIEIAYIDVPEEFSGTVINRLNERKGELQGMSPASDGTVRLEYHIPSRKVLLVTSVMENEGKSTVAANLALSLAQEGSRVMLIDCDFRKPAQYKIFNVRDNEETDLGDVLINHASTEKIIRNWNNSGTIVFILP